jgi:NTP pyrophosphatase (non-canonical NTP hydrolase)
VRQIKGRFTAKRAGRPLDALSANDCVAALHGLMRHCHKAACVSGWWQTDRNFGELIALIHSELSEALEAGRKDLVSDHLPDFSGVEEELADVLIRVFDLAGALGIRLGAALIAKLEYNRTREDHKPENRAKAGGKAF